MINLAGLMLRVRMVKVSQKVVNSILDLYQDGSNGYVVASSSMVPALNPGDRVEVEPVSIEEIKVGMVIVFRNEFDKLIVHRVVKKSGDTVITAGDSVRRYDSPVNIGDIIGKVKGLEIADPLSMFKRLLRAAKRRLARLCNY